MPAVQPHVIGLKETLDALKAIGKVVTVSADRKGLYAAAKLMRDEVRKRVPVRTGSLKKNVVALTTRAKNKGGAGTQYVGRVTISKTKYHSTVMKSGKSKLKGAKHKKGESLAGSVYPRNYAHLVEFGTRPHSTRPISKAPKDGHLYPPHPGARPRPFMRPAAAASQGKAMEIYRKTVLAEVDKKAQQLAAKAQGKKR